MVRRITRKILEGKLVRINKALIAAGQPEWSLDFFASAGGYRIVFASSVGNALTDRMPGKEMYAWLDGAEHTLWSLRKIIAIEDTGEVNITFQTTERAAAVYALIDKCWTDFTVKKVGNISISIKTSDPKKAIDTLIQATVIDPTIDFYILKGVDS